MRECEVLIKAEYQSGAGHISGFGLVEKGRKAAGSRPEEQLSKYEQGRGLEEQTFNWRKSTFWLILSEVSNVGRMPALVATLLLARESRGFYGLIVYFYLAGLGYVTG